MRWLGSLRAPAYANSLLVMAHVNAGSSRAEGSNGHSKLIVASTGKVELTVQPNENKLISSKNCRGSSSSWSHSMPFSTCQLRKIKNPILLSSNCGRLRHWATKKPEDRMYYGLARSACLRGIAMAETAKEAPNRGRATAPADSRRQQDKRDRGAEGNIATLYESPTTGRGGNSSKFEKRKEPKWWRRLLWTLTRESSIVSKTIW